ncbi:Odorant receptor Or77 [Rhyzopertha dominica]|nr:Odorant receptor Or77 [Rhyzopertha dominica]
MDFSYKPMKGDYLSFIKWIPMTYYKHDILRALIKYTISVFFVGNSVLTFLCLTRGWNVNKTFVAGLFFSTLHEVVTVYLLECLYNDIMVLDETMEDSFWDIAEASPVLRTHLYKMFSNFKLCEYLIWTNTLAFSLAILLLRFYPNWPILDNTFLCVIYVMGYTLNALFGFSIVIMYAFVFFYYCIHAYVQTGLLGQYFSQIAKGLSEINQHERDKIIRERLLLGFRQHKRLRRFADEVKNRLGGKRMFMPFITVMCLLPVWFLWAMTEGFSMVGTSLFNFLLIICAYGTMGEIFFTGYDECPQQLYKSNWYRWNKQNKDLLLLFVVLAGGEQSVGLFYPIKARLHDFLWFLKTLYSIAALLRSVYL